MSDFWQNRHALSPLAEELEKKFLPSSGPTSYVETEVMRAIGMLHHDCYNNGFGNNMSRSVAYIETYYLPRATPEFRHAFARIREAAIEPFSRPQLDDEFNIAMAEIFVLVRDAEQTNALTPIDKEVFDMPSVEIEWVEEDDDDWFESDSTMEEEDCD